MEKKVLIITYYWPPAGGPGVFRWLQLSKYLSRLGVETHVLTVDPKYTSYYQIDESNISKISKDIQIHKTKAWDPINIVQRLGGKSDGQFNTVKSEGLFSKLVNYVRSNFFIPDTRKGWNKYAVKKAIGIIDQFGIKNVITTSPPHSTQLIGLTIKSRRQINWIADFRDPWVDIFYQNELLYTTKTLNKMAGMELSVLRQADKVLIVSSTLKDEFIHKSKSDPLKFRIIPNGYDQEIFDSINATLGIQKTASKKNGLELAYIGTITDSYQPLSLLKAIKSANQVSNIKLKFVGSVSQNIKHTISEIGLDDKIDYLGLMSHEEAIIQGLSSDVLVLIIPKAKTEKGIITGKMFEYLAMRKPIIGIGPSDGDAAAILSSTKAGKMFEREQVDELSKHLLSLLDESFDPDIEEINAYSRESQVDNRLNNIIE